MNKVYLVVTEQGDWDDYMWKIHCICSTKEIAEEQEKNLRGKINAIKNKYKKEFGRDYDYDRENMFELEREERWEQIYKYEAKNEELKYHTIRIEEKDVL